MAPLALLTEILQMLSLALRENLTQKNVPWKMS